MNFGSEERLKRQLMEGKSHAMSQEQEKHVHQTELTVMEVWIATVEPDTRCSALNGAINDQENCRLFQCTAGNMENRFPIQTKVAPMT